MKAFRRILFSVLVAGLGGSFIGDELYGLHYGFPLTVMAMGFMTGLTIWSMVFLKVEPNLTRLVLLIVLAYPTILFFIGLGAGGA
jgi:hypothetical protein